MQTLMGTVEELILLAEVVEAGGFSAASVRCGIPTSRLSRRIAKLEERLGVGLIRRDSRRFEVTELGQRVYQQACSVRDSALSAVEIVRDGMTKPSGLLRVACPVALAMSLVMPMADAFARRWSGVQFSLHTTLGAPDTLAERFDIIIHPSAGTLPDSSMVAKRLGASNYVLVATPEVAQAAGSIVDPRQLARLPTIGWEFLGPRGKWRLVGPHGNTTDVEINERFNSDTLLVVREAALSGLGIAPLPSQLCSADIEDGRLQIVLPGWSPPPVTWYAVYASRRALSAAGQQFITDLVSAFELTGL